MKLDREILAIMSSVSNKYVINEDIIDKNLQDIGIDSITFIKIVIAIETQYRIEFDYEMLITSNYSSVQSLIEYVEKKVSETPAKI